MIDKLKTVTIRGFKSIKDATVDLSNINILIGPNGSGKSNFISALSFLQKTLEGRLQRNIGITGLQSVLYGGSKETDSLEMEFSFGDDSYGFKLVQNDNGNLVFEKEFYKCRDHNAVTIPRTPYGYESEIEKCACNDADHLLKPVFEARKWRVFHFHDTTSTAGMKQTGYVSDSVSLHPDASNLAPFLYMLRQSYRKSYDDIVRVVKTAAPYFDDFVLVPNTENHDLIRLRWRRTDLDNVLDVSQLSDGTMRFICLSTLLLQPSELQPETIIIDEPELGLHPSAVSMLAEMIHLASLNKQLIISTQSADLVDDFDADDIIVAEMKNRSSSYRRLTSDSLKEWLEDYSLGTIWKKNVFGGQP